MHEPKRENPQQMELQLPSVADLKYPSFLHATHQVRTMYVVFSCALKYFPLCEQLNNVIFCPIVRSATDDDMVRQKNREELNKEVQKEKPKKEVLLVLSRHTFSERRALVVSESDDVSATSLLREFPEFYKPYVVSNPKYS